MAPVPVEDNFKLLAAYCVTNGDMDSIAKYMGITKNAVAKRYAKLTADEKETMEKVGIKTVGSTAKKRSAPNGAGTKTAKKLKKGKDDAEDGAGDDDALKAEEEVGDGNTASDEAEAGSEET